VAAGLTYIIGRSKRSQWVEHIGVDELEAGLLVEGAVIGRTVT
jgi:hypothetical protein